MASTPYFPHTPENGIVDLYLEFAVGGTGAVGVFARNKGFTTSPVAAVRTGAGAYTLNLDARYQAMVDFNFVVVGTTTASDGQDANVVARNLNVAQPNITIQVVQSSGAAADPASGVAALIHLKLKSSTV